MYEELTRIQARELLIKKHNISVELSHNCELEIKLLKELTNYLSNIGVINSVRMWWNVRNIEIVYVYQNKNIGYTTEYIDYITFYFGNYYKYERVYDMWLDLEKRFEILCIS